MAKKSCALIGPGVGPKVHIGTHGRISSRNLGDVETISVRRFLDDGTEMDHTFPEGEFPFLECRFIQVTYKGSSKKFISTVMIGV